MPTPRIQKKTDTLLRLLVFLLVMTLVTILGPTRHILEKHHAAVQKIPGFTPVIEVDVAELEHEDAFLATITSCLPDNKKCKQFLPTIDGRPVPRVAVISPPGSNALVHRIQSIHDTQVIIRTHVPPYGYGKTHGLTKVIRIIPQPLVLQVTDALQSLLQHGETHSIITLDDLKAALRQILRFHCRISHLAAHTALLSVNTTDDMASSSLYSFLGVQPPPQQEEEDDDDDHESLYEAHAAYGTQILTHVQEVSRVNVMAVLDQVLLDELKLSKNLTIWPCPSFWSVAPIIISPLVQRLAKALSPDCEDPYAKCWVERDKCEAAGDAVCAKK